MTDRAPTANAPDASVPARKGRTPTVRHAARIVLLDARDRILMLRCQDPDRPEKQPWWITPGGGLEDGESHEQALRRELREEIGLIDPPIGPPVWTRVHTFPWRDFLYQQHERYFFTRVEKHDVSAIHRPEEEKLSLTDHRWWTIPELRQTHEPFAPPTLPDLLPPLIAGDLPTEPIDLNAHPAPR